MGRVLLIRDTRHAHTSTKTELSLDGLDVLARIGEVLDITVDHLLYENAERRPRTRPSTPLDARLADLDQLTDDERTTITNVIDALVTKNKLRAITSGAS